MRKLAPVFLSSVVLLASGSALALGDMHKHKNAPSTNGSTTSSTYNSSPSSSSSMNSGSASASSPSTSSSGTRPSDTRATSSSQSTGLDNAQSHMSSSGLAHENATNTPAQTRSGQKSSSASDNGTAAGSSSSSSSESKKKSAMSGTSYRGSSASGWVKTHYGSDSPSKATSKSIGDRCDKSVHATLPADCKMTGKRQDNATNSTQGASGGPSGSGQ